MPATVKTVLAASQRYAWPFQGPVNYTAQITLDVSAFYAADSAWVDSDGFLKPGTPVRESGVPISAASQYVYGVVIEPVRIGWNGTIYGNTAAILNAADDIQIAVATLGQVIKEAVEDNMGRSMDDNEVKAFAADGSHLVLLDYALNT